MRKLVYDVAASLDGFIAGPDDDVSAFLSEGDHVGAYLKRLKDYDTVVMGRATYEFGYRSGMKPGERPYPHMQTYVVSSALKLPEKSQVQAIGGDYLTAVRRLKAEAGTDIYLCGGGALAANLLVAGLIDRVIVKLNPIILGAGTPLFAGAFTVKGELTAVKRYKSGVVLLTYDLG